MHIISCNFFLFSKGSDSQASRTFLQLKDEVQFQETMVLSLRMSLELKEKEIQHHKSEIKKMGKRVDELERERNDLSQR